MAPAGDTAVPVGLQWGLNTLLHTWKGVWDASRPTLPLDNSNNKNAENYLILFTDGASVVGGSIYPNDKPAYDLYRHTKQIISAYPPSAIQMLPDSPAFDVQAFTYQTTAQYTYAVSQFYTTTNFSARVRALKYCELIKSNKITLYVVGFGSGAQTDEPMLQQCASPGKYYQVDSGPELIDAFKKIGNQIKVRSLRLRR